MVGLDPMLKYVPEQVRQKAFAQYGETLEGAAEAIWQFNKGDRGQDLGSDPGSKAADRHV